MTTGSFLLASLLGTWVFEREIEAEGASMSGEAVFVTEADGSVLYREEGELLLRGGHRATAYRRYRFNAAGNSLIIEFADGPDAGNRFVDLSFGEPEAESLVASDFHLCGADRYDVIYRLDFPKSFETDISVVGPRKGYQVLTRYRRPAMVSATSPSGDD